MLFKNIMSFEGEMADYCGLNSRPTPAAPEGGSIKKVKGKLREVDYQISTILL